MKSIAKMITASAAALSAFALVAMAAPAAQAGEYCMTNTSGMRGCGYATLEQLSDLSLRQRRHLRARAFFTNPCNALANDALSHNALAYQRKPAHSRSELGPAKQSVEH